jgi:hypothetical protein
VPRRTITPPDPAPATKPFGLNFSSKVLLGIGQRALVETPGVPQRIDAALIALVFSVMAVEAVTNEIFESMRSVLESGRKDHPPYEIAQRVGEAEMEISQGRPLTAWGRLLLRVRSLLRLEASVDDRTEIKERIKAIAKGAQRPADFSCAPFQDLIFLIKARNTVVHLRAQRFEEIEVDGRKAYTQHGLVKTICLRSGTPEPKPDVITPLVAVLGQPTVGRWAYETATSSISIIHSWFPPHTMPWLTWMVTDYPPPPPK